MGGEVKTVLNYFQSPFQQNLFKRRKTNEKNGKILMSLTLIMVMAFSPVVSAQCFPRKSVEFIVPWAAGGGVDTLMRAIAAVFPKYANNQQLIIKNVPGGGGAIGFNEAAKARPDGYTLLPEPHL